MSIDNGTYVDEHRRVQVYIQCHIKYCITIYFIHKFTNGPIYIRTYVCTYMCAKLLLKEN